MTVIDHIGTLGIALGLTLAAELGVLGLFCRDRDALSACLLGNLLTNPCVNLIYRGLCGIIQPLVLFALSEVAAFVCEALIYRRMTGWSRVRCCGISFLLNLISCTLGILIF